MTDVIIDFRMRPPFPQGRPFENLVLTADLMGRMRLGTPPQSYLQESLPLFLEEMDAAGITAGAMVGRHAGTNHFTDEDLAKIQQEHAGRFYTLSGVDLDLPMGEILARMKRAAGLGLRGFTLAPGMGPAPRFVEDRTFFPIYETAVALDLPFILSAGPIVGPDIAYGDPAHIDRVAEAFPALKIVVGHGGYPFVEAAIGLIYRRPNVTLSPDCYLFMPGCKLYVDAMEQFPRQFVFGTHYPFQYLPDAIARTKALGLSEATSERYLRRNAEALLKIDGPA
jgi:predicted TIM-barrel fold metal-dependent hydrolase